MNKKILFDKNKNFKKLRSNPSEEIFLKSHKILIWCISLGSKRWFRTIFGVFEFLFYAYCIKVILGGIAHTRRKLLHLVFKKKIFQ